MGISSEARNYAAIGRSARWGCEHVLETLVNGYDAIARDAVVYERVLAESLSLFMCWHPRNPELGARIKKIRAELNELCDYVDNRSLERRQE
jgi:hypothetical protein